jgi:hypothetical protein
MKTENRTLYTYLHPGGGPAAKYIPDDRVDNSTGINPPAQHLTRQVASVLNFGAGAVERSIHWILLDSIRLPKRHKGLQPKVACETERIVERIESKKMHCTQ